MVPVSDQICDNCPMPRGPRKQDSNKDDCMSRQLQLKRNTLGGIAFAYNLTVGVVGGTAPMVCTWLTGRMGDLAAPAYYLMFLACISLVAVLGLRTAEAEYR